MLLPIGAGRSTCRKSWQGQIYDTGKKGISAHWHYTAALLHPPVRTVACLISRFLSERSAHKREKTRPTLATRAKSVRAFRANLIECLRARARSDRITLVVVAVVATATCMIYIDVQPDLWPFPLRTALAQRGVLPLILHCLAECSQLIEGFFCCCCCYYCKDIYPRSIMGGLIIFHPQGQFRCGLFGALTST